MRCPPWFRGQAPHFLLQHTSLCISLPPSSRRLSRPQSEPGHGTAHPSVDLGKRLALLFETQVFIAATLYSYHVSLAARPVLCGSRLLGRPPKPGWHRHGVRLPRRGLIVGSRWDSGFASRSNSEASFSSATEAAIPTKPLSLHCPHGLSINQANLHASEFV